MDYKHYKLIVIGSGAGLNVASAMLGRLNWKVAVIEDTQLGGTCLNRGCIPSKIIIHSADVAEEIKRAKDFGINAKIESIDFETVIKRANEFVDHDSAQIEKGIKSHPKIDLYKTRAEFIDEKKLKVSDSVITGDHILIAAGTRPNIPPIQGLDNVDYLTSTEALRLTKQPKSMIIIGGGYIAAELGHFYGALGTDVSIVQRESLMLSREDLDIAKKFTELFAKKYNLILNHDIVSVKQESDGKKIVTLSEKNGKIHTLSAEQLLVATGVTPNSDTLKVENAGIKTNDKGYIEVDKYLQTSQENIWALGDIVGKAPFRHTANYESHLVVNNLVNSSKIETDYDLIPHAIFSSPQIAGIGLTETQAKEKKLHFQTRLFRYNQTAMGKALEENEGFVKWILDAHSDTILGCHIIGPQASVLIHEVAVVMKSAGAKLSAIRSTIHIHPTLSEVIGWSA